MITINSSLFIAKGQDRACYVHPEDSSRCIKITVSGDYKQSVDEIKTYSRLLKRNISWKHLAKFYGVVETDKGQGLVFDLIRDHDGNISKGLSAYLVGTGETQVDGALLALEQYLLNEGVILRDLNADNLLFQKSADGSGQLMIVDGVGNNDYIPLADYIPWLAKKKIKRKWARFGKRITQQRRNNNQ